MPEFAHGKPCVLACTGWTALSFARLRRMRLSGHAHLAAQPSRLVAVPAWFDADEVFGLLVVVREAMR